MKKRLHFLLALLPALLAFGFSLAYYYPFLTDDSMISYRYAERFLNGHGLTWTDGIPVEGYSNLLYTLLIAAMGALGFDLIVAGRVLGIICGVGIMVTIGLFARRDGQQSGWLSMLFLGMCGPIAIWALGGLEALLLALLLALAWTRALTYLEKGQPKQIELLWVSLWLGLACLCRPDAPLFCVAMAAGLAIWRWPNLKKWITETSLLAVFPTLLYGGQALWRKSYYGEWVPNTARVKISPSERHFWDGLEYVGEGLWVLFPFSLLVGYLAFRMLRSSDYQRKVAFVLLPLLLVLPYLVFIGGDIFPGHRHIVPLIPLFAIMLTLAPSYFTKEGYLPGRQIKPKVMAGILAILLLGFGVIQFTEYNNRRAKGEKMELIGRELAWNLKEAFSSKRPRVAVTAAGCIPYHTKFPALDMLGLNDYWLPRNPPKTMGKGWIGHELGNADYVLKENPDLIIFDNGQVPSFWVGDSLLVRPQFFERYRIVKVRTTPTGFATKVHFNLYSEKIGVKMEGDQLFVPPYLLGNLDNSAVNLDQDSNFQLEIRQGGPLKLDLHRFATPDTLAWNILMEGENVEFLERSAFSDPEGLHIKLQSPSKNKAQLKGLWLRKEK